MSGAQPGKALQQAEDAALQEELHFFREHEREWARERGGWFVLLGKETFGGFHRSYEEALQAGLRAFGPVAPFLIRKIGSQR
jgi:hypothetical protein